MQKLITTKCEIVELYRVTITHREPNWTNNYLWEALVVLITHPHLRYHNTIRLFRFTLHGTKNFKINSLQVYTLKAGL